MPFVAMKLMGKGRLIARAHENCGGKARFKLGGFAIGRLRCRGRHGWVLCTDAEQRLRSPCFLPLIRRMGNNPLRSGL